MPDELYQSNGEVSHLDLTIINGEGFSGYIVVHSMDKIKNYHVGEGFYFCLVHKQNALCGSGKSSNDNSASLPSLDALALLGSITFDDN